MNRTEHAQVRLNCRCEKSCSINFYDNYCTELNMSIYEILLFISWLYLSKKRRKKETCLKTNQIIYYWEKFLKSLENGYWTVLIFAISKMSQELPNEDKEIHLKHIHTKISRHKWTVYKHKKQPTSANVEAWNIY